MTLEEVRSPWGDNMPASREERPMLKAGGWCVLVGLTVAAVRITGPRLSTPVTPAALQAEIAALRAPHVAWREIAWKSCLLEGLKESRSTGKPALLWIFIDRPADDERC
jgi:hypothetical protein